MPARRNGISPTLPGSSKPSCSQPTAPAYQAFHPSFNFLFNSYYNAVGERLARPRRGLITRPTLDEVYAYRASVDRAMESFLESAGRRSTPMSRP